MAKNIRRLLTMANYKPFFIGHTKCPQKYFVSRIDWKLMNNIFDYLMCLLPTSLIDEYNVRI